MSSPTPSLDKSPLRAEAEKEARLSNANYTPATSETSSEVQKVTYTAEEEKRLLRKSRSSTFRVGPIGGWLYALFDLALLPGLTFLYLLSFLDRSNVGNANDVGSRRLYGLLKDIGLAKQPEAYNTSLALYFLGYVLFEIPANAVLKRYNPRVWLPSLTVAWGIVAICQAFVTNKAGFYVARTFMGIVEAGLFPGCVFVFSMYYKRKERHWRVALFFGGAALAGAFGGVLAYGISFMEGVGGHAAWYWIFVLEGVFTVLVGLSAYFWVPDYPRQAKFLTDRDREILITRLAEDSDSANIEPFKFEGVKSAVKDHLVIAFSFVFHGFAFPLYSLSLFLPTIIQQLGYASWKLFIAQAQLLTTPIYASAFLAILLAARLSATHDRRGVYIIASGVLAIIGYIVILATHTAGARLAGAFLAVMGIYAATALLLSWPAENISGQTRRATATATQIFIGDIGAIAGVLVYRPSLNQHFFRTPHIIAIGYTLFGMLSAAWLWYWMRKQNLQRASIIQDNKQDGTAVPTTQDTRGDRAIDYVYQL
ncbi:BZ3500_MvSof-1268-A1-R1_Chr12-2g03888 [Microbotryum saponariae]|uniref:BZ3500_MvSof-1268-A1-R1_Chr12-2g03888 protein n=1 Tax=Microbotryum saponariae TaxID=289078 RepID=A0A2X0L6J9_9BASI|nr:BZ3500_MvSof-1268-A1-R1_Chr12-2g03888 [Microbotryum saponariae]